VNSVAASQVTPDKGRSMLIQVLYYAEVRELAGLPGESMNLPTGSTTADLVALALRLHPKLDVVHEIIHVILNGTMITTSPVLRDGDTVALIPPTGGG
jgi:molybdopterin converting factor small subunit